MHSQTDGPPGSLRGGGLLDPSQVRWSAASARPQGSVHPEAPGAHEGYSPHSPQPSFVQPTIPSDPFGSGSIRQRESGSGDVRTIPGGSGSLRQQSPEPSFIQPSVHSFDPHARGSYHREPEGSDDDLYTPQQQHPSALSIPSPTRSTSRPPSFSLHGELAHLASRFMMKPRKNMMWKPNGPKDVSACSERRIHPDAPSLIVISMPLFALDFRCGSVCAFRQEMEHITYNVYTLFLSRCAIIPP